MDTKLLLLLSIFYGGLLIFRRLFSSNTKDFMRGCLYFSIQPLVLIDLYCFGVYYFKRRGF